MPFYFAYGSNMDEAAMRVRCPRSTRLGPARLAGHRFVIMGNGWASVRPEQGATVHGVLFDLAQSDVRALDRYEDVAHGLYTKALHPVLRHDRGPCRALIYFGTDPTTGGRSPDGYVEAITMAARAAGLPEGYVAMLDGFVGRILRTRGEAGIVTIERVLTVAALRERVAGWRAAGLRIALVPTMGALHAGHMRLVEAARSAGDRVVATIFVNPKQFAPSEDFASYPRDLDADCRKIAAAGGDLVFVPDTDTMYPIGFATTVHVEGPAKAGLEDRFRPHHFAGVATVVAKLLLQARPDVALFGEKDFQQLRVIERLVADLDLAVEIVGVPIVREGDGLAMSSRNAYLSAEERARAPALQRALAACAAAIVGGQPVAQSCKLARAAVEAAGFAVDYVEVRRANDLAPLGPAERGPGQILAAARLGRTRLIDNVAF